MKQTSAQKMKKITVLVLDVDGILTDGSIFVDADGREWKAFHTRDGVGIVLAKRAGLTVVFFSGNASPAVEARGRLLGVDRVLQGVKDKETAFEDLLQDLGVPADQVCYMGDDLLDLQNMKTAGLAATVPDAVEPVREAAHWISLKEGGKGAVRELIEELLKAQGTWDAAVEQFCRGKGEGRSVP